MRKKSKLVIGMIVAMATFMIVDCEALYAQRGGFGGRIGVRGGDGDGRGGFRRGRFRGGFRGGRTTIIMPGGFYQQPFVQPIYQQPIVQPVYQQPVYAAPVVDDCFVGGFSSFSGGYGVSGFNSFGGGVGFQQPIIIQQNRRGFGRRGFGGRRGFFGGGRSGFNLGGALLGGFLF